MFGGLFMCFFKFLSMRIGEVMESDSEFGNKMVRR